MCQLGKRGRLKGVGRGSNTLTWECSLSRESLFTFKIPAVTVIAICHPITVLLDNRKLPAPPPPALFTAGEQLLCLRALGASCRGGSGSCSCCFSFMKCTHLSLLEGARGEPCQGSDNPDTGFWSRLLLSSPSTAPLRLRGGARRAGPAQPVPPAAQPEDTGARHRRTGPAWGKVTLVA